MRSRVYETVERPSVCPVDRQQQRRAAGLLLSASRAGDIDGTSVLAAGAPCSRRQSLAATAGSVMLTADVEAEHRLV